MNHIHIIKYVLYSQNIIYSTMSNNAAVSNPEYVTHIFDCWLKKKNNV